MTTTSGRYILIGRRLFVWMLRPPRPELLRRLFTSSEHDCTIRHLVEGFEQRLLSSIAFVVQGLDSITAGFARTRAVTK